MAERLWRFKSSFAHIGRLAQLVRASLLHSGGRGFESLSVHTNKSGWRNGIRKGLKSPRAQVHAGSSPAPDTGDWLSW